LTIFANQEFGEIPFDVFTQHAGQFIFEVFVDWMGVIAVDIDFDERLARIVAGGA